MYLLLSTADNYLSSSLEFLTVKFKISQSLAGVTLLAFGNGAPDIFSSISSTASSASNDSTPDDPRAGDNIITASTLIGSSTFLSTIVLSLITFASV